MAAAYQGLGYLESGITEPLNRFAEKMLDFSALLKHAVSIPSFSIEGIWR
jgi:sorting nexin-4